GGTGTIVVAYSPTVARIGTATLVLSTNDGLHPTLRVPVSALARDLAPCQVSILPGNPVDFGAVKTFDQTVQGFELVNEGQDDCIFGDPEIISGGPAFYWPGNVPPAGRQIKPGARMSVRVAFNPESERDYTGQVAFYMSNKAQQTVLVDLHGKGNGGCFFITPGAVDFSGTQLGCGIAYQVGVLGGVLQANDVIDQFDQSTPKVDMLIVIDNSGSMAEEQRALAANLDHLWNRISLANADFHIAITTTGMQAFTSGFTQCPGGAQGGEGGRFFPVDNSRPRLLTPATPDVRGALSAHTAS